MTVRKADSFGSELRIDRWGLSGELRAIVWPNIYGLRVTSVRKSAERNQEPYVRRSGFLLHLLGVACDR